MIRFGWLLALSILGLGIACTQEDEATPKGLVTATTPAFATPISAAPTNSVGPTATASSPPAVTLECKSGERSYADPARRFSLCYPASMKMQTADTPRGPAITVQIEPIGDVNSARASVTIGIVQEPLLPCDESLFEIRDQRIERIVIGAKQVDACLQDIYDWSSPPIYLYTTGKFAVPTSSGVPLQVVFSHGPPDRRVDGTSVRDIAFKVIDSITAR